MKSTKDNRPAVKFSDIVKELHSYANSEQAVIDFASELEKVINLSEEFELSQYYFEDNDAKNYLRKKLNFKSVILTGIKSSTTTISNIKDDFFEIYKNCYHKYVKSGNPFFNRLSIMYDLNLYYDIEQKKFVIYEATNVGYPGDFEFYSKKDFYGTYINRVDSIFPVSISTNWEYLLYFDYETGELSPVNENIDKTIRISLVNKKNNSSSYNIFDKLCIEFSNAIWNNDSKKFDNLLVDLLKKSIEDKVRELLVSDYTLDDVTYKIVPLSLLTDNEIKSTLFDLSYEYKFNFSSIDEVISNTKDLSQIDRLFVLMREVVLEN